MSEGDALSLPKGWKEVKLEEVCFVGDGAHTSIKRINSGVPYLTSKNFDANGLNLSKIEFISEEDYSKHFKEDSKAITKPKQDDILLSIIGSLGSGYKVNATDSFGLSSSVSILRSKETIHPHYLLYWLKSPYFQQSISNIKSGVAQSFLSLGMIKKLPVILPPLDTQRKIANILSGYDDLIENNLKRIKILEEMAQQTYEEWFVRMRFPGCEIAVFDENGLPEGWERVKCFDAMEVLSGGTPKTDIAEYWNGGIEFFTPKDAKSGSYTNGTEKTVTELGVKKCNSKLYPKDTVFITARGTVGKLNLASKPMIMNQSCYALKGKNGITQFFLFCAMNAIIETFKSASNGGVFNTIIVDTFKFLDFVIPEQVLISKFEVTVNPIYDSILNLQSQNQRLREARDILLPRLMMGMIDVLGSSAQLVESLETKPTETKIIPLEQPKKEAPKEFKEAVLIACLTERFGSEKFPLGRKRYTKLSYLFHRYSDNKIQDYLRKAAGPYNPKTKYGGPEKIALNNKYIQNWKSDNKLTGFVSAEKIEDAKTYFSNYWQIADLDWLTAEFKFKSNDELELLATVDNSLVELSKKNLEFTSTNVLDIIKCEKEWEAKLERTIFSDSNVERAIGFLRGVLEYWK